MRNNNFDFAQSTVNTKVKNVRPTLELLFCISKKTKGKTENKITSKCRLSKHFDQRLYEQILFFTEAKLLILAFITIFFL